MNRRSDPHRPGAIVPNDYEAVLVYAIPTEDDQGLNMVELAETVRATLAARKKMFGGAGKCGICGANYLYGELWRHCPTGDVVHIGHDCAAKYELLSGSDWEAQIESLKARRAAHARGVRNKAIRAEFLAAHPGLAEALAVDHTISADLARRFHSYLTLSEKQVALALKIARETKEKSVRPVEVHVPAPVTGERQHVEGTIVKRETRDDAYGWVTKVTVKVITDRGVWLAWGTLPTFTAKHGGYEYGLGPGDVIAFDAVLKVGREPHFALFKRPTKAVVVSRRDGGAAPSAANGADAGSSEDPFAQFDEEPASAPGT